MAIGDKIRYFRKQRQLTIRNLSRICGLDESYLSRIENNRLEPQYKNLVLLAVNLHVNVDDLLSDYFGEHNIRVAQRDGVPQNNITSIPLYNYNTAADRFMLPSNLAAVDCIQISSSVCNIPDSKAIVMGDASMVKANINPNNVIIVNDRIAVFSGFPALVCLKNGVIICRTVYRSQTDKSLLVLQSETNDGSTFPTQTVHDMEVRKFFGIAAVIAKPFNTPFAFRGTLKIVSPDTDTPRTRQPITLSNIPIVCVRIGKKRAKRAS